MRISNSTKLALRCKIFKMLLKSIKVILLMSILALESLASVPSDTKPKIEPLIEAKLFDARTTVERYVLGSTVKGALPIYSKQKTSDYANAQNGIVLDISYPEKSNDNNQTMTDDRITKVELYLEGSDGFQNQAYVIAGGIGERNVDIQIVAKNTRTLRYSIIIYGISL